LRLGNSFQSGNGKKRSNSFWIGSALRLINSGIAHFVT
jgi:hypothetical protein